MIRPFLAMTGALPLHGIQLHGPLPILQVVDERLFACLG
jgi:hypothetical protein